MGTGDTGFPEGCFTLCAAVAGALATCPSWSSTVSASREFPVWKGQNDIPLY